MANLDGRCVREYLAAEVRTLVAAYGQFETLLPAIDGSGASHAGEDGRYVESLVRQYLQKLLPNALEVSSGFILRPSVKTGINGKERAGQVDEHSTQLDIIVYDSANYPVFQRFGDSIIVPPEGVIAIISIKKHLRDADVKNECKALYLAAKLCRSIDTSNKPVRGPFLALLGVTSKIDKKQLSNAEWIFSQIQDVYQNLPERPNFDELVGYIGTFKNDSIFKKRPVDSPVTSASYVSINHKPSEEYWALLFLLTGVLSVFYDPTRNWRRRPGYSGFESGRKHDGDLGSIPVSGLR